MRFVAVLIALAVVGALFAAFYYQPEVHLQDDRAQFHLEPGEVGSDFLEPSVLGGTIQVNITVANGTVDVYVMDQEWLGSTIDPLASRYNLSRPFSYHAEWTRLNVSDQYLFLVEADGETRYALVLDNSDTYYNDTPPGPLASVAVQTRYLEEESKSLILGYAAVAPSALLVGYTFGRKLKRRMRS